MKILIAIMLFWSTLNLAAQENQNLRLEDALNKALQNNYGIIITQKSKEIAELQNAWGNTGALPNIQFVSSGHISENFEDSDNYTTKQFNSSVEMNWTIFRGFSARIRKSRLEELEKLSQGNVAVVVENTIYNVILAYYNILLADEQASIARDNTELSGDRYERGKHSKEIGAMDTYELLQAKNAYLKDSSDFLSAQAAYRNAVRELNYQMAEPLDMEYNFVSEFIPDTTRFEYTGLQNQMLENNSTLKNQYMNLELARLDVKSSKSPYYPSLSLTGSAGYQGQEQDYETMNQFNQGSGYNTSAGISLSYTIFDGNSRKRALDAARMEREISEVQTEEMEQDLKNQLAQEYELYRVRKQLLRVARENLESAELNLSLSREKFENGTINSFNFRDVQQIYMSAAYEYQNAVFRVIQSYHTLLRLTGGIIDEYE
ncbi:MAG: TolC family protein [Bacteroidota bacterium]